MEQPNNECIDGELPPCDTATIASTSVAENLEPTPTPESPIEVPVTDTSASPSVECQTDFLGKDVKTQTEPSSAPIVTAPNTNPIAADEKQVGLATNDIPIPTIEAPTSKVKTMSWNSTGRLLAMGYTYQHQLSCNHASAVLIFPMISINEMLTVAPRMLKTCHCLTHICFHPERPYMLAASSFIGDIYLWNIEQPYTQLLHKMPCHTERVTGLAWIRDPKRPTQFFLASSGVDGFLRVWNPSSFEVIQGFKFRLPVLQAISAKHRMQTTTIVEPLSKLSVLAFDFSIYSPEIFVVGLIGGMVVQCSSIGAIQLHSGDGQVSLLDPIVMFHKPMKEEIATVSILLHRTDTFLVAGTMNEIRVYMFGRSEPVQVFFSRDLLKDIFWVRASEKLVSSSGKDAVLEYFHLIEHVDNSESSGQEHKMDPNNVLTRYQVKPVNEDLLPEGCKNGNIQFWSIAWGRHY